jgi:hypothetical protein
MFFSKPKTKVRRTKMKKSLSALLLALSSFFVFVGISQAGQCIYLYNWKGKNYYYDSSDVRYAGDIVSFTEYEGSCSSPTSDPELIDIDCARRVSRGGYVYEERSAWYPISPGSPDDIERIKLCGN